MIFVLFDIFQMRFWKKVEVTTEKTSQLVQKWKFYFFQPVSKMVTHSFSSCLCALQQWNVQFCFHDDVKEGLY